MFDTGPIYELFLIVKDIMDLFNITPMLEAILVIALLGAVISVIAGKRG